MRNCEHLSEMSEHPGRGSFRAAEFFINGVSFFLSRKIILIFFFHF